MAAPARLATEDLAKTFAGQDGKDLVVEALGGVDIAVGAGEFVSVIGPSGCGKSTLLDLLAGLEAPTRGRILLDGRPAPALLGEVAYMPQSDLLMPWRTVVENAALPLELAGLTRPEARRRALAEFPAFRLSGFERAWPDQVSGGMRQRVALLRTFLAGHELMLLDEPFGALDALTRQVMQEWLLEIWHAERKTIVFVTHDVEEALFLSDRVYVMTGRPGRVALELDVDLERPRRLERTTLSPRFTELKQRLLEPLVATTREVVP